MGMDYETFINSAFLLQGRADEFTNKTPAERKAVLSSILGLDAYDRFQSRAREQAGERRSEADRLDGRLSQLQTELEATGDPTSEMEAIKQSITEIGADLVQSRGLAQELRTRTAFLQGVERELLDRQARFSQTRKDIAQLEADKSSIEARIQEHRTLVSKADEIREAMGRLQEAQRVFAGLQDSRREHDSLRQSVNDLNRVIQVERTQLETEIQELRRRVAHELLPQADEEPKLIRLLEEARYKLEKSVEDENTLSEMRDKLNLLSRSIGEGQSLEAQYISEGKQLKEKLRLLEEADSGSAICPLCLSPLSEEGCQRLSESYDREINEKRELYLNNRAQLLQLEKQREIHEGELALRERAHTDEVNQLRTRIARAETLLEAAREASVELQRVRDREGKLVEILDKGDYALESRASLETVEQQLASLAFNEEAYQRTYQQTVELEPFNLLNSKLELSLAQLVNEEEALNQNQEMTRRRQEELLTLKQQIGEGEEAVKDRPRVEARLSAILSSISQLEAEQQSALTTRGLLEGRIDRRQQLQTDLERNQEASRQFREEYSIYQELTGAFGRQGVQAMLIETVVPRLEEEANFLLGRMTDNRMHVKLETQRERRAGSGDPIETLQINVSDELGSRSYEMYSGGEGFRVNLALRIALSRVLSQRTGAPLPTLFIDEGFGTQDASGRERILDVISAIEDDFDKIIVITHLDDLKDMFPVRIEVQKDANGSTFWLS